MSCRHEYALGTCKLCYPKTGTIMPEEDHDGLDGPGAVPYGGTEPLPCPPIVWDVLASGLDQNGPVKVGQLWNAPCEKNKDRVLQILFVETQEEDGCEYVFVRDTSSRWIADRISVKELRGGARLIEDPDVPEGQVFAKQPVALAPVKPVCPLEGVPCFVHGFEHGKEAEELRERFEELMARRAPLRIPSWEIEKILREVDARDSVGWLDAKRQLRMTKSYARPKKGRKNG